MPTTMTPPAAAIAGRLLFAAWYVDDEQLTPAERTWLQQRLADRTWTPSRQECVAWRLRLVAWASRYQLPWHVMHVLEEEETGDTLA